MKRNEQLSVLRHSAAHIMAAAVKDIFPFSKIAIGPSTENGFYYDFDTVSNFTQNDLKKIEKKMIEIINHDYIFNRTFLSKKEVVEIFKKNNEKYKVEIALRINSDKLSIYKIGNFTDLCAGPHIVSTGKLKYFKLISISGVYWSGDSSKKQLQRIYGTAFFKKEDLDNYLYKFEEAKKIDHRKLGKDLDLFSINDVIGPGLILWHHNGVILRDVISNFFKKIHLENNYEILFTPHITSEELFKISGHLQTYLDNMYTSIEIEGKPYRIKPMNCPMHLMIYKTKIHSYKELPIRYAELATVYRFEKSGVLHGLLRARGFTQDDGHLIVESTQLENEITNVFNMAIKCLKTFGFNEYKIHVATRPVNKYIGRIEDWDQAQHSIENVLKKNEYNYEIDEGGGAFYGPKIDIKIKDSMNRYWQCSTIQFDFNLSERFNIYYIDSFGEKKRPYIIHRALLGSLERFIGILLEHYAGSLPIWLCPIQVAIININNKQYDYCLNLFDELIDNSIRVIFDDKNEKIGYKIRKNSLKKIPYIIVIGDEEMNINKISVRARNNKNLGVMEINDFIFLIKNQIKKNM